MNEINGKLPKEGELCSCRCEVVQADKVRKDFTVEGEAGAKVQKESMCWV